MGCDLESVYVNLPVPTWERRSKTPSKTYGRRYAGDVMSIDQLDQLVRASRKRVFDNLRHEAAALGANLVVGVRQVPSPAANGVWYELAAHHHKEHRVLLRYQTTLDFQLVGTAVRDPAVSTAEPRLTTVSATDFCKLRDAGWHPAGVASGCSHKFGANVVPGVSAAEMTGATALWADARAEAFAQTKAEMSAVGAHGMIGLEVAEDHAIYAQGDKDPTVSNTWLKALLVMVSMIATVVVRGPASASAARPPMRILTLR
jgi:uncharacterized protein YbjQ (UPF0145 family)